MLYTVVAQVVRSDNGWRSSAGVPTFLLDSNVQGIEHVEHAASIAYRLLRTVAGDDAEIFFGIAGEDGSYATEKAGQRVLGVRS
jgi:hypothetical protein